MVINSFRCENFRNIPALEMEPCGGTNVIYGENAQGKTNLIEGLWMFTGAKSFRAHSDGELIKFGSGSAYLKAGFYSRGREQTAEITIEGRRGAQLNGVKLKAASELCGNFFAVVFSPVHLSLIQDGPAVRRRMLDTAIGLLFPNYVVELKDYYRALSQRNAVLKDARYSEYVYDMLENFEAETAKHGARIVIYRKKYTGELCRYAPENYASISGGRETLSVGYATGIESETVEEAQEELAALLKRARGEDMASGNTSVGPHREDVVFGLDGSSARVFGSQGQQRSCVLALKLSEAQVIKQTAGEQPVMLFDDVMSELDENRQDSILNRLGDVQVFVTCCDPAQIKRLSGGRTFRIENGGICG